ncbi:hypothetical protein HY483_02590 [Candidatus Woesearchaeota archaeon]|nr:hypothetical protein [Candidatus Woesearchaeota archaeon]
MRTCPICEKGNFIKVEDIILEIEGYIFILRGERCTHCKEEYPYEEETSRAVTTARKLGVWPEPLKLHRRLSKSSGGLILRMPSDIEKQLNLSENTPIEITKIGNKIIIEPVVA